MRSFHVLKLKNVVTNKTSYLT